MASLGPAEGTKRTSTRPAAHKARSNIHRWLLHEKASILTDPEKTAKENYAPKAVKKREDEQGLSEYELERLENIRHNQAFLSSIKLLQAKEELTLTGQPKRVLQRKSKSPEREVLPLRKSERLQNKKAMHKSARTRGATHESGRDQPIAHQTKKLRGPCHMNPLNLEQGRRLPPELIKLYTKEPDEEKVYLDRFDYQATLRNMKLTGDAKVVNRSLSSAAFHPCTSSLVMAAGNTLGQVGLWSMGAGWGDDGVLLFEPHTRPVGCMSFSKTHPANLLSLSYDGSLRCMDVERAVFDEVYDTEDALKSFDFLSHDCSTLVVGHLNGDLAIVDQRSTGTSWESLYALDTKMIHSVNVHPVHEQYIVVAETKVVSIYDSRYMKRRRSQAVSQLHGHSKPVISAYFSPSTGNRVLTSCKDNIIRVYDTSSVTSSASPLTSLRLAKGMSTRLGQSAVWDPKQENCFLVSRTSWPRTMDVFHQGGTLLHSFLEGENFTTVLTIAAFHPSRNALLGGDASGNLHVFTDYMDHKMQLQPTVEAGDPSVTEKSDI